jgi:anti-sigma regulatory factor (Ser/Thr protein kinase)
MDDEPAFYVGDEPDDLAQARDWLAEQLHRSWLLDEEIDELNLALTEALTNLLQHAQPRTKSELTVQLDDTAVHVFISDDSPPFQPGDPSDADRDGGYGLLLLHMLTDEVDVTPGATGGSVLRLTKRRPAD